MGSKATTRVEEFKMADAEGTETTQIEGATKPLEKEKIETIDEEQSTGILMFRCLAFSSRILKLF